MFGILWALNDGPTEGPDDDLKTTQQCAVYVCVETPESVRVRGKQYLEGETIPDEDST